jgi:hypothetical protein
MKPLAGVTTWALALAFLGGFAGGDSTGALLVALSAWLQSCAAPHAPWRWATLAITAWAAGSVVVLLVMQAGVDHYFDVPDAEASSLAVLSALSAAYLGAVVTWVAGRLARER